MELLHFLFWPLIVLTALLAAYTGNYQATTLWAGKKIADPELSKEAPNGFQDAITPKEQNLRNTILPVLYIIIPIIGFFIKWYFVFIGIFAFVIIFAICQKLISNKLEKYLWKIMNSLDNRYADYYKNGDAIRGDAAKELADKLMTLYFQIRDKNLAVPTMKEARKMPLGSKFNQN